MTDLKNRVVLITGAAGGFGQHFIRQFLTAGSRLILSDVTQAQMDSCVSTIRQEVTSGEVLQCIPADLATVEGCEALYRAAEHTPDILVNNAGIAGYGRFDEIPSARWELVMQINLLAPMRLLHLFLPDMVARRSGHIVNIASLAGWVGSPGMGAYAASKFGLRGFGEVLYEDYKPLGIKVTTVYPFYSRTPILDSPKYGSLSNIEVPDSMTTDPADIVREVIVGIQRDKQHVFPDTMAKQIHWIKRLAPWLIPIIARRLEQRAQPVLQSGKSA